MRYRKDMIKRIIPREREIRMNIVFSSDKKEYNTIKKGTEILLAENDGFNQNIELFVKFQDRPEILINKRKKPDSYHLPGNISLLPRT